MYFERYFIGKKETKTPAGEEKNLLWTNDQKKQSSRARTEHDLHVKIKVSGEMTRIRPQKSFFFGVRRYF
jgi:hypothetical protein